MCVGGCVCAVFQRTDVKKCVFPVKLMRRRGDVLHEASSVHPGSSTMLLLVVMLCVIFFIFSSIFLFILIE